MINVNNKSSPFKDNPTYRWRTASDAADRRGDRGCSLSQIISKFVTKSHPEHVQSIEDQIEKSIKAKPRGTLLFPEDFNRSGGSAAAIRKALQRLKEQGLIKPVAHGIYVRPKTSDYIGELIPSAEEIAKAIAERDKIRLIPTGAYAQHALGLTTQMPLNLVFLTDGAPRTIQVGKRTIKLKRTTPKNLMAKGAISSLVIQALRDMGKDQVTMDDQEKIIELLRQEHPKSLKHDIQLAPEWIRVIMKKALNE